MNRSKLINSYLDNINRVIKVSDLKYEAITEREHRAIISLAKNETMRNIKTLLLLLVLLAMPVTKVYSFINSPNVNIGGLLIACIMPLILICIVMHTGRQIFSTFRGIHRRAQYGIVVDKYTVKSHSRKGRTRKTRYISVLFEEMIEILEDIKCSVDVYTILEEGDRVLVISFDGKKAYVLPAECIER